MVEDVPRTVSRPGGTPSGVDGVPGRIVVVGAGMAGISAVTELRTRGYSGALALVDAGEFPYDRPPLSKAFLLGTADLDKIKLVTEAWFGEHDVEFRAGRRATALRPGEGVVDLDDGTSIPADTVLLTTGGDPRRLLRDGAAHTGIRVLRTVQDSIALRELLVPGARAVIVGGGLIGAEVASGALTLGCEVTLIEPLPLPLEPAVGPQIAAILKQQHVAAGIRLVTDTVERFGGSAGSLAVRTGTGESIPTDVVLVGIGMIPRTDLAVGAGLEVVRAIVTDGNSRTSNAAVFAAGDAAAVRGSDGVLQYREHWQAALVSGAAAAAGMLGQQPPATRPDWFWTDRHGVHVEALGSMVGPRHVVRGEPGQAPISVFNLDRSGRLLGAATIDDHRVIAAAQRLIGAGTVVDPELLRDTSVNLRALVL